MAAESSAKRKRRLRAMLREALSSTSPTSPPIQSPSNPLLRSPPPLVGHDRSPPNPNLSVSHNGSGSSSNSQHSKSRRMGRRNYLHIKAMVKDPWRKLKPVVVRSAGPCSWLPKSVAAAATAAGTKRPKLWKSGGSSAGGSNGRTMSLAECLALAMEEVRDDDQDLI